MPRYFFDLHNDVEALDDEGVVLDHIQAAVDRAFFEACAMIRQSVGEGKIDLRHHIDVRDEVGVTVAVVQFGEAVQIVRDGLPIQEALS